MKLVVIYIDNLTFHYVNFYLLYTDRQLNVINIKIIRKNKKKDKKK